MRLINDTSLAVGWLPCQVRPPEPGLTVVAKAVCQLRPDAVAEPLAEIDGEPVLLTGDLHHDDDTEASLRCDTDLAPHKPNTDVILVGHARAPGDRPVPALTVGFGVDGWHKRLSVFGDRSWLGRGRGARPTDPQPFRAMPLRYERAFGGPAHARNPLGIGAAPRRAPDGGEVWPLPNIVDPGAHLGRPGEPQPVAGFGPLHRTWPQRRMTGTYDDAWLAERWPWFPDDFDWRHFSAAPDDQRLREPLRGDETLTVEHMHPEHPVYRARLPGMRARVWLHARPAAGAPGPLTEVPLTEVPLRLDTLWVDMDAARLVLLWRGHVGVPTGDARELADVVVGLEPLAGPALTEAHARAKLAEADAAADDDDGVAPTPAEPAPEPAADPAAGTAAEDADDGLAEIRTRVSAAFDTARKAFTRLGVSPAFVDRLEGGEDPADALTELYAALNIDPAEAQRALDQQREAMKMKLTELGVDPAVLDPEPDDADAPPPDDPDAVAARAAGGQSMAGADLGGMDLRGRDLTGAQLAGASLIGTNLAGAILDAADLSGANLTNANLHGARLVHADLTGACANAAVLVDAVLTGASLAGARAKSADATAADLTQATLVDATLDRARLAGAILDGADLSGARLVEADLANASLAETLAERADFTGARLAGVQASGAGFAEAVLRNVTAGGATLDGASLAEADLAGADLTRASLVSALMDGAHGDAVVLAGATMPKAMVGEGAVLPNADMRQISAAGAMFTGATLTNAVLTYADLPGSDFADADLTGADLHAADLRQARLPRAILRGARVTQADLFRADLEGAELTNADLSESNAFEAEFLDAAINRRTRLRGANLGRSKLAAPAAAD
jgi:uncharacterized protein YjbI with pentapeptide repeats